MIHNLESVIDRIDRIGVQVHGPDRAFANCLLQMFVDLQRIAADDDAAGLTRAVNDLITREAPMTKFDLHVAQTRDHLIDDLNALHSRLAPSMKTSAAGALARLRSFVEAATVGFTPGTPAPMPLIPTRPPTPSADRVTLDTIRGIVDELSGKPSKAEAIGALGAISDLIGAGAIEDDEKG